MVVQKTLFGLPYQLRPDADRIAIAMSLFDEPRSKEERREWRRWIRRRARAIREAASIVGEGMPAVRYVRSMDGQT